VVVWEKLWLDVVCQYVFSWNIWIYWTHDTTDYLVCQFILNFLVRILDNFWTGMWVPIRTWNILGGWVLLYLFRWWATHWWCKPVVLTLYQYHQYVPFYVHFTCKPMISWIFSITPGLEQLVLTSLSHSLTLWWWRWCLE
jgi:hypothetical protein